MTIDWDLAGSVAAGIGIAALAYAVFTAAGALVGLVAVWLFDRHSGAPGYGKTLTAKQAELNFKQHFQSTDD